MGEKKHWLEFSKIKNKMPAFSSWVFSSVSWVSWKVRFNLSFSKIKISALGRWVFFFGECPAPWAVP
jgi:hypothetical protein